MVLRNSKFQLKENNHYTSTSWIKIQGEELRAEGKKRDELQEAITVIEAIDIGLAIKIVNFRD